MNDYNQLTENINKVIKELESIDASVQPTSKQIGMLTSLRESARRLAYITSCVLEGDV